MYKNKLEHLQSIYGGNVMCTDGLFHIMCDNHEEIYINSETEKLDGRCKYKTIVVFDKTIVAEVIDIPSTTFVILAKNTLECIYQTSGYIKYIDNNLVCDYKGNTVTLISNTGKVLCKLSGNKVTRVYDSKYILSSNKSFDDRLLCYNVHRDSLQDITADKRYLLYDNEQLVDTIEVVVMHGGKYYYNFKKHEVINQFTNEKEEIQLWSTV